MKKYEKDINSLSFVSRIKFYKERDKKTYFKKYKVKFFDYMNMKL